MIQGGAGHTASRLMKVFGHLRLEIYRCMTLPWESAREAAKNLAPADGIQVRIVQRAELAEHARDAPYELSSGFLEGIASRKDICLGAFKKAKLVGYCFFASEPTAINPGLRFHFHNAWIYVYKAFTLPEWRGKGLQRRILFDGLPALENWWPPAMPKGFVTLVMTRNQASLHAFGRAGFKRAAHMAVLSARTKATLIVTTGGSEFAIGGVAR